MDNLDCRIVCKATHTVQVNVECVQAIWLIGLKSKNMNYNNDNAVRTIIMPKLEIKEIELKISDIDHEIQQVTFTF